MPESEPCYFTGQRNRRCVGFDSEGVYLGLVDAVDIDTEEWVREVRVGEACRVREVEVDDEDRGEREEDVEPEVTEADVGIPGPYHPIAISVPEHHMLLQDRLPRRSS